ncbi:MAG: ankyrin repeat domain-containing protein [Polyangiaceae bacterium]
MGWWKQVRDWLGGDGRAPQQASARTPTPAKWLAADATPFGYPVLDLISVTGQMISASENVFEAETSVSWRRKTVDDVHHDMQPAESLECQLAYAADADLPDGWLFTPTCMEEKWAIALRGERVVLFRSWTAEVKAYAEVTRERGEIHVHRLHLADDTLRVFGDDPVQTFDWILRSHALGQVVPFPCSEEGAALLEAVPLSVFSLYGNVAAYAAPRWVPPAPRQLLRTTSAVVTAVLRENPRQLTKAARAGVSLNARAPGPGFTALHVAAAKDNLELTRQLLELGADPNVLADGGRSVLTTGLVHGCSQELLALLVDHGADPLLANEDGFGPLHALAETNKPHYLNWLLSLDADLEQRTNKGHTALQIAAALGHVQALKALLFAGANPATLSADAKTARDIAIEEAKSETMQALDAWAKRRTAK